jgi:TRAP-type C4-dicarboxylate transport system permease large subunit
MSHTVLYVLGALAVVGLFATWRSGRKSARKARKGVREVTRMTGNAIRTLLTAAVIVGIQWAVIAWWHNTTALTIALIVPALFAGAAVARLLAVTEIVTTTRGHH